MEIIMAKLKYKDLLYMILLTFLFEPNIFVKYKLTNYLFVIGALISFAYIVIYRLKYNRKIYKITLLLIFWRILLILRTFMFDGDILKVGYQSIIITAFLIVSCLAPLILIGINPVFATMVICIISTIITMYLVGGFNAKSTSASLGTILSILFAGTLSYITIFTAHPRIKSLIYTW